MARKAKQTVEFFPHYCLHKMTMFIIEEKYGNDGYAFWFKLLEMLGISQGHYIDCNKDSTWEFIQAKTKVSGEKCAEILETLAKLEAIDKELWNNKIIWSDNFIEGVSVVYKHRKADIPIKPTTEIALNQQKSTEMIDNQQAAEIISGNQQKSAEIVDNQQAAEIISGNQQKSVEIKEATSCIYKERRGEERRGEESKSAGKVGNQQAADNISRNKNNSKKEFSQSVYLTTIEYDKLIERFGEKKAGDKIEALSLYKLSKGKKYSSDYATILNWDRREQKEKDEPVSPRKREEPGVPSDYGKQLDDHLKKIKEKQG